MKNLLSETIDAVHQSGHTVSDITFIGSRTSGHQCTWAEFSKIADVEYDDQGGSPAVATDLVVAFSDGKTMWRGSEYSVEGQIAWRGDDLSQEFWVFDLPFTPPAECKPIRSLMTPANSMGWKSLARLNP